VPGPHGTPEQPDPRPIRFRGESLRLDKGYLYGTHRAVAPVVTLGRLTPFLERAGVTRLANITGLDYIGVPTTLAIRPAARSMVGSAGKGFTFEAALVSAAMEAFELHYAENIATPPDLYMSYRRMTEQHEIIALNQMPFGRSAVFSTEMPYHWILGWDILHDVEVAVPLAAVRMSRGGLAPHEAGVFHLTSNGLASGNGLLEALNAALFEVIERDAVSCHWYAWRVQPERRLPLVSRASLLTLPLVAHLMDHLERADVELAVLDCRVDTDVPVYMAWIWNKDLRGAGANIGYGAHFDTEVAVVRAVTEAIQGRAVMIAGSRDNIFQHEFRRAKFTDNVRQASILRRIEPVVDIRYTRSFAEPSFEGDTARLTAALKNAGLDRVIVLVVSEEEFFGSVVKVLVPALEGPAVYNYAPGARARRFAGMP
jgi:ribosomal protein S12 methylthiotransferase accessory factor